MTQIDFVDQVWMIRVGKINKLQRSSAVHTAEVASSRPGKWLRSFMNSPVFHCQFVQRCRASKRFLVDELSTLKKQHVALQGIAKRGESSCCLYAFERLWGGFFGHKILETWLWVSLCSLQCMFSVNMSVTSINSHIPVSSHFIPCLYIDFLWCHQENTFDHASRTKYAAWSHLWQSES